MRTNRKDDIFMQRRLYNDETHTALDIFRFAVFFTSKIITKSKQKFPTFWDTFFNMFLPILSTLPFLERI